MKLCTSKCLSDSFKSLSEAEENCNHLKTDIRVYD